MFRATIVALALGSATAFVARAPSQRVTALRMAEEGASATEEKMDLDLEDMFDLFDEADSEVKAEEGAGFETSAMSQALPWMKRPASLEAAGVKIAGDRGFEYVKILTHTPLLLRHRRMRRNRSPCLANPSHHTLCAHSRLTPGPAPLFLSFSLPPPLTAPPDSRTARTS